MKKLGFLLLAGIILALCGVPFPGHAQHVNGLIPRNGDAAISRITIMVSESSLPFGVPVETIGTYIYNHKVWPSVSVLDSYFEPYVKMVVIHGNYGQYWGKYIRVTQTVFDTNGYVKYSRSQTIKRMFL